LRRTIHTTGRLAAALVGVAAGCDCAAAFAADAFDWSLGLRGSYASSSVSGGAFEAVAAPEVSLTLGGAGASLTLGTGAELAVDALGQARLADVHASADGTYAIDSTSSLAGSVDLALTQAAPGSPLSPTNTAVAPLTLRGTAEGSGTTRLGPLEVTAGVNGARRVEGQETLYDATVLDHADDSYWRDGATLRVGLAMSPLLTVFAEGAVSDQHFDAATPALAAFLDNRTYTLRGGVSYTQGSLMTAEISAGRGFLDYSDAGLSDGQAWVAGGFIKVTPDDTVELGAALDTAIGPSDTVSGDIDAEYTLSGTASYAVNPWLTLRSSAGARATQVLGTGSLVVGYSAGAGLDLMASAHATWSADYLFTHDGGGPEDTHTVTVGLRIKG
jgi:hypothetical protein